MDAGTEKMEKGEERVEDEVNNNKELLGEVSSTNGNNIDQMEQNKVSLMRAFVQTQDPSSKLSIRTIQGYLRLPLSYCKHGAHKRVHREVDDLMIRRFLRARDLDIEKASGMFLKYLKWKRSFVPNGFISESEIPKDLAQKKLFLQGLDKSGRPIVVTFGAKHFPKKEKGGLDEFKRFVVYALDKIGARMPRGQEKFMAIADLEGWAYSNSDIRGYLGALSILQDCYPERLGKLYLVHVPYLFMTAWKLVYPFIDSNTKKKIVFVENKKLKSTLLQDIDESQLPEIYGGKQPLVPIEES